VLPARFPNLLCNGSQGIAVGMATSIPPHNLREVADALISLIRNPDTDVFGLMEHVRGPDFPTGGIICGKAGIVRAYRTGRGQITIRARATIEQTGKDREQIVVTEIPYQVSPNAVFDKVKELLADKTIEGISGANDETDRTEGLRLVFEVKKGFQADVVLNQLFRHTPLQSSFSLILIALSKNRPHTFSLKEMLAEFVGHRTEVIRRRTRHLKRKAEERLHVVLGLLIAIANIDEIIRTIKESADPGAAREALVARFALTERQAGAILDMRLARLTALEHEKLEAERAELEAQIRRYEQILGDVGEIHELIVAEMEDLKVRFPDARRTEIVEEEGEIEDESLIPNTSMLVTLSHQGYIKRMSPDIYRAQGRGGKGITGVDTKEGDFIERLIVAESHDDFLVFTADGWVHWLKVYKIPELGRTSQGRFIENLLDFGEDTGPDGAPARPKVMSILPVRVFDERFLFTVSRAGHVKKTPLVEYSRPKRGGIIGVGLKEGDALIRAIITSGQDDILLSTAKGQTIRFGEADVRPMGRPAAGVIGVKFKHEGDHVVDVAIANDQATLLTVCAQGYGKRSPIVEYPVHGRGGQGVVNVKGLDRNGDVVAAKLCKGDEDLIMISEQGMVVRTPASDVREIGRASMGVRVMTLNEADSVVEAILVEPLEEAAEPAPGAAAPEPAAPGAAGQDDGGDSAAPAAAPEDDD
jgi:DNA gyrase subunit A